MSFFMHSTKTIISKTTYTNTKDFSSYIYLLAYTTNYKMGVRALIGSQSCDVQVGNRTNNIQMTPISTKNIVIQRTNHCMIYPLQEN